MSRCPAVFFLLLRYVPVPLRVTDWGEALPLSVVWGQGQSGDAELDRESCRASAREGNVKRTNLHKWG